MVLVNKEICSTHAENRAGTTQPPPPLKTGHCASCGGLWTNCLFWISLTALSTRHQTGSSCSNRLIQLRCHKDRCRKSFLPSARALFHTSVWLRLSALHVVKCSVCLIFTTCIFCSSTLILLLKLSNELSVYSVLFKTALWYNYQKSGKAHTDWSFKTPFAAPCWWVVGSPDILIFRCRQMKRWGLGLGLG